MRSWPPGNGPRHEPPGRGFLCAAVVLYPLLAHVDLGTNDGTALAPVYAQQVDRRLDIPESQQRAYAELLAKNLAGEDEAQYVVIVDRNKFVQAAMIYWMSPDRVFHYIGASPVSTGKPGRFEHFITPTGVFEHTIANLDFLSEGTRNQFGIRGYGRKGMRVYDFGWQTGQKGWDGGGEGNLRLQMHATDPDLLEQKLGTPQSKGCIRIPATLNAFIDHYGILDGDYEKAMAAGMTFWVLSQTREATPWSGRFLVVVDTGRTERPAWSLPPSKGHRRQRSYLSPSPCESARRSTLRTARSSSTPSVPRPVVLNPRQPPPAQLFATRSWGRLAHATSYEIADS